MTTLFESMINLKLVDSDRIIVEVEPEIPKKKKKEWSIYHTFLALKSEGNLKVHFPHF